MKEIKTIKDLNEFANLTREKNGYKDPIFWAIGRVEKGMKDKEKTLSVNYAHVNCKDSYVTAAILVNAVLKSGINVKFDDSEAVYEIDEKILKTALKPFKFLEDEAVGDAHKNLQTMLVVDSIFKNKELEREQNRFCVTFIYEDSAPKSVESVYLKLYLLSTLKVPLKSLNLNGAFGILPNVAWDENAKPIELEWLRENEIWLKMYGAYPRVISVDKFPRYLSHVIPSDNTRVLDDSKVRMGAVLAHGTTVMPGASYVNFNSGTKGAVMIEGRVSSAVEVGEGSDIGGGASILGVLSGTNGNAVTIGKNCLLGANSVTGIPLGDNCVVDGGIAVLEGSKVYINEENRKLLATYNINFKFDREIYKASELSGLNGLHFRIDTQSGQMVCALNKRAVKLNENLH